MFEPHDEIAYVDPPASPSGSCGAERTDLGTLVVGGYVRTVRRYVTVERGDPDRASSARQKSPRFSDTNPLTETSVSVNGVRTPQRVAVTPPAAAIRRPG